MIPVSFRGFPLNAGGLRAAFDRSYQRPGLRPIVVKRQGNRPILTGVEQEAWQLPDLGLLIDDAVDVGTLRLAILRAFDTRAGAGAFIVTDDDGTNERYMYAICQEVTQKKGETGDGFVATLVAADDEFWRSTTPTTVSHTIDHTVKNITVTNGGDVDAHPAIRIGQSVDLSDYSYWRYRRFVPITWRAPGGQRNYPYELTDGVGLNTASLAAGGKLTAGDAHSLGIIVDGQYTDHWYANTAGSAGGFNSTTTRIWTNLDFGGGLSTTLTQMHTGEIEAAGDISAFPSTGILQIDSELFTYTGCDLFRRRFTGVTREAYESAESLHYPGAAVYWIQHEVWIVYSVGLTAPDPDDARKPIINLLNSSNAKWEWAVFGSTTNPDRPGGWLSLAGGTGETFTGDENGAATDPYQVMGLARPGAGASLASNFCRWHFYSPCGIAVVDVTGDDYHDNGLLRLELSSDGASWAHLRGSPGATVDGVWTSWSDILADLASVWRYVRIVPWNVGGNDVLSQLTDAEVTFQSALRPTSSLQSEQTNYYVSVEIRNVTTGERLYVTLLPGLHHTAEAIVIDTEAHTAVIEGDGRNIYHALRRDALRPDLLRLLPGANDIWVYSQSEVGNTMTLTYTQRWYL